MLGVLLVAESAPAHAQSTAERIRAQREELERIRRERADLERQMSGLQGNVHELREEVFNLDRQREATERVKTYSFIDDVRYGEEWIEKLYRLRNIAGIAGLALGFAFAIVSVIIIGATIRMAVLARSREISIMRLVGATDSYIRRPFLIEGFAKGVLGGLLALVLTWVAQVLINRYVIETVFFTTQVAVLGLLFGALIGLLGSAVSVGRHLRHV